MRLRRLGDLAKLVGGELVGSGNLAIEGVAPIAEAGAGEISFAESLRVLAKYKDHTQAAALLVPREAEDVGRPHIKVANPRLAFAQVLTEFSWAPDTRKGIDPTAVIDETAEVGKDVTIGPQVIVGAGAKVGRGTILMGGVYIGAGTVLGEDCLVYPHVCIRERLQIGSRVTVHAGAVIGEDGFGFVTLPSGHVKVPHIGTVIIEDDVEIGANSAVERGTCGATIIGRGTKIGNLVQVGHNVRLGENCLVVAMTGIAGSAIIGDRVVMAGQSGIAGHLTVGDDCVIAARGLVAGDLPPGSFVSGFPARSHRENMRILAAGRKLPELLKRVKQLEDQLASMAQDDIKVMQLPEDEE
ncbi:MAG: UDP-3-O-(3-hydroxymyristoyl)glucosamine N-acyltransferase [Firmicutes bacterium]|nr:UDP-3-O-(3-hydroxymyristoyl)glucosamine N-acyltransferase [Bacillota bacterium]